MLLTVRLYGTPGFQAPLIHLRRERDYGIFDQLAAHIEDLWQNAEPLVPATVQDGSPVADASDPLDDLDIIWRPAR